MSGLLAAALVSFGVIFVAELGDKSQLMTMTFATRYRSVPVLLGVGLAVGVLQAISVGIGYGLGAALPTDWISMVAGLGFMVFAAWTLRNAMRPGDDAPHADETARIGGTGRPVPTPPTVSTASAVSTAPTVAAPSTASVASRVSVAFFVAELGDKTMLATVSLATKYGWFGTWLGSTLAMIAAGALAVVVGRQIGRRVPARLVGIGAAGLFAAFGLWMVIDSMPALIA